MPDNLTMKKQFALLTIWFCAISVPMMYLMGLHSFAFKSQTLAKIAMAPEIKKNSKWKMVHILSSKCACSKRVGIYLSKRSPLPNVNEVIYILDDQEVLSERKLKEAGFKVVRMNGNLALEKYDIDAAPQLVILDEELRIKYSGGYNDSREMKYEDLKILASLKNNQTFAPHPVFGCANGKRTAELVDPWGLKY